MARKIDLSKALSDADRRYLADRDRWHAIAEADGHGDPKRARAEYVANASAPTQVSLPPTNPQAPAQTLQQVAGGQQGDDGDVEDPPYEEWTYPELQAELKERKLNAGGKQDELIARLYEHDEQEAAKGQQ